jgi:dihydroorotate dehydrogenase (NAD+) catalytic subunit
MKQSVAVDLGGVRFPHPVLSAAGCLGSGRDLPSVADAQHLGGIVTQSLTFAPRKGSPSPRAAETASGLLSWVGLQNPGVEAFVEHDLPRLARTEVPIVASVAGTSIEECLRVAGRLDAQPGIVALEMNVSAPEEEGGEPFSARPERIVELVGAVARVARLPVFVKLPALVPDLVETARSCVRGGAHGLTLIDQVPGLAVDADRLRSRLAAPIGGLSGPAIKPIALGAVHRVAQAMPEVPIMGVGGVATGADAVEFLLAGAWAVQVGTALLVNPSAPVEIAKGILGYLREKGISAPADLRGRLRVRGGRDAGPTSGADV